MKRGLFAISLILSLSFYSCGPSAEQRAAMQKAHDDSVRIASAQQERRRAAMEQARQDSIKAAQAMVARLKDELETLKAKLESANDEMGNIKSFHFLRSDAERQSEIEKQSKYIQQLNDAITQVQNKINSMGG